MWLSKIGACAHVSPEGGAEAGLVTIGGEAPGVQTDGERRGMTVSGPGGYHWTPRVGQQVLVIKTAQGERIVAGALDGEAPEEVRISAGGAELCLKNGNISITGTLLVTGALVINGVPFVQ